MTTTTIAELKQEYESARKTAGEVLIREGFSARALEAGIAEQQAFDRYQKAVRRSRSYGGSK